MSIMSMLYKSKKKFHALGIVSPLCKKTCWLVNLSSCNECLFSIIFEPFTAGRVGIAGYCICSDNNDSYSRSGFEENFYLLSCRSLDDHCWLLHLLQTLNTSYGNIDIESIESLNHIKPIRLKFHIKPTLLSSVYISMDIANLWCQTFLIFTNDTGPSNVLY